MLQPFRRMMELWSPFFAELPHEERDAGSYSPEFAVRELSSAIIVEADLPGVDEKNLEISLDFDRLVVHGTRPRDPVEAGEIAHVNERPSGSFMRAFTLPSGLDIDRTAASLENGVLTVTIPRSPDAQPRKITVGTQGGEPSPRSAS